MPSKSLLVLALLILPTFVLADNLVGDANNSGGAVMISDAALSLEGVLGIQPLSAVSPLALANDDGRFDIADVMLVAQGVNGQRVNNGASGLLTLTPPAPFALDPSYTPVPINMALASNHAPALVAGLEGLADLTVTNGEASVGSTLTIAGQISTALTPLNTDGIADLITVRLRVEVRDSAGGALVQTNQGTVDVTLNATGCGNGVTEAPEACDDGNMVDDDRCSNACLLNCPNGYNFDGGPLGWTSFADNGGFDLWSWSPFPGSNYGWYMGNGIAQGNYLHGTDTITGALQSPLMTIYPGDKLSFWEVWGVEPISNNRDKGTVRIVDSGGAVLGTLRTNFPSQTGNTITTYSLAAFVGQQVRVQFYFDSVDGFQNDYFGWRVDNVYVGPDECICGNTIVDLGETCDDGNQISDGEGGCLADCSAVQVCGDSIINGTEACDEGDTTDCGLCNATCSATSPADYCGDGVVCGAEQCDDGNTANGDGCQSGCTTLCGDGIVMGTEQCDDGNASSNDSCTTGCVSRCQPYYTFEPDSQGWTTFAAAGATLGSTWWRALNPAPYAGTYGYYAGAPVSCTNGYICKMVLQSPLVTIQPNDALNFWEQWSGESRFATHDLGTVRVVNTVGAVVGTLRTAFPAQSGGWVGRYFPLDAFAGQQVRIEFFYDTVDTTANSTLDWKVDEVFIGPALSCWCGNNVADPGEACDDGNAVGGDGCSANCLSDESCGNGILDAAVGEACDDGANNGALWTPPTSTSMFYNGHMYGLDDTPAQYSAAVPFCATSGGYVVSIGDSAENTAVKNHALAQGFGRPWLGATDMAADGVWLWDSGEPFVYNNWDAGYPTSGTSNCMTYRNEGSPLWMNVICDGALFSQRPVLCEYETGYCSADCSTDAFGICGNGLLDSGEACDDGVDNGTGSGFCLADCSGIAP